MSNAREFPPIHPGEILLEEYIKPMSISQYRLAKDTNVDPRRSIKLSMASVRSPDRVSWDRSAAVPAPSTAPDPLTK